MSAINCHYCIIVSCNKFFETSSFLFWRQKYTMFYLDDFFIVCHFTHKPNFTLNNSLCILSAVLIIYFLNLTKKKYINLFYHWNRLILYTSTQRHLSKNNKGKWGKEFGREFCCNYEVIQIRLQKNAQALKLRYVVMCLCLKNSAGISLILNSNRHVSAGQPKTLDKNPQISQRWRKSWLAWEREREKKWRVELFSLYGDSWNR